MAELMATENEAGISLENWMLNESNFTYSFETATDNEISLELEGWMAETELFEAAFSLENETEEELEVSEWMTSESNFLPAFSLETESEETIELEAWMLNEESFSTALNTAVESHRPTPHPLLDVANDATLLFDSVATASTAAATRVGEPAGRARCRRHTTVTRVPIATMS